METAGQRQGRADTDGTRTGPGHPEAPLPPHLPHRNADPQARAPQCPPSLPPGPVPEALAQRLSKLIHWPPSGRAQGWGGAGGEAQRGPGSQPPLPSPASCAPCGSPLMKAAPACPVPGTVPGSQQTTSKCSVGGKEPKPGLGTALVGKEHGHTEPRGPGPRGQEAGPAARLTGPEGRPCAFLPLRGMTSP